MEPSITYYIGWDVGAWKCTKRGSSCDAIVILEQKGSELNLIGTHRDNLIDEINASQNSSAWVNSLFIKANSGPVNESAKVVMAIDAPLGYSTDFRKLLNGGFTSGPIGDYRTNPYLFRETERFLSINKIKALSAINDMIGSQSTKAMHVLAKFNIKPLRCGVWSDGNQLTVIETYPSPCREQLLSSDLQEQNQDIRDAFVCAKIAQTFDLHPDRLAQPTSEATIEEGWIWVLKDSLTKNQMI